MSKFCSNCGKEVSPDDKFCNACGAKVIENKSEEATQGEPVIEEIKAEKATDTPVAEEVKTEEVEEVVKTEVVEETVETIEAEKPAENTTPLDKGLSFAKEKLSNLSNVQNVANDAPNLSDTKASESGSTPLDKGMAVAGEKFKTNYQKFKASPNRDKYIGFTAIGIVFIVAVIIVFNLIFSGGYKGAVSKYADFLERQSFHSYQQTIPGIIFDAELEKNYDNDKDKFKEAFESDISSAFEAFNKDEIKDVDYEILDKEDLDDDEIEDIEEENQNTYDKYLDKDIEITKAYKVKVKLIFDIKEGNKTIEETQRCYLTVCKINGDWGIMDVNNND